MPDALPPLDTRLDAERPSFVPPLVLGTPEGEGWVRVADLATPYVLRAALEAMAEVRGYPDPITKGAGFALVSGGGFADLAFRAALGARVPLLMPERTWWQLKPSANVTAVAAEAPPAFVPSSQLGEALHTLLDDLYAAIHVETGFPVRGQWAMLTSLIGHWLLAAMPAEPERAVEIGDAIFASDTVLGAARPRVTWLDVDGRCHAFTTRRVCCFNYRGRGGHYCGSQCPVVPAEARVAEALSRARGA